MSWIEGGITKSGKCSRYCDTGYLVVMIDVSNDIVQVRKRTRVHFVRQVHIHETRRYSTINNLYSRLCIKRPPYKKEIQSLDAHNSKTKRLRTNLTRIKRA